jgi:hypothetical protein
VLDELAPRAAGSLYVRAVGSYARGDDTCGDIDILAIVGDAGVAPGRFLAELLGKLCCDLGANGVGRITGDIPVDDTRLKKLSSGASASYYGVWLGANNIRRRIDLFVRPPSWRMASIFQLTSGKAFNRALEHWAGCPPPDVAARALQLSSELDSPADAFDLDNNGSGLWLARRRKEIYRRGVFDKIYVERIGNKPLPLANEQQVFECLCLSYVPLHKRSVV